MVTAAMVDLLAVHSLFVGAFSGQSSVHGVHRAHRQFPFPIWGAILPSKRCLCEIAFVLLFQGLLQHRDGDRCSQQPCILISLLWAGQAVMTPVRYTVFGKRSSGFDFTLSCRAALVHPGFRWLEALLQPHSPCSAAAHLFFVPCRACRKSLRAEQCEQGRSIALRIGRSACRAAGRFPRGVGTWTTCMYVCEAPIQASLELSWSVADNAVVASPLLGAGARGVPMLEAPDTHSLVALLCILRNMTGINSGIDSYTELGAPNVPSRTGCCVSSVVVQPVIIHDELMAKPHNIHTDKRLGCAC